VSAPLPTVSVVIPCYRYGRFLRECVRSVLDQEGVNVRVLIIDDASPDDSGEVAAQLATEEDRVEVRHHAHNQGHIATYNEGLLEWADGDYSILISADDVLTAGSMARATAVLEANPNIGFVYGHALRWNDNQPKPATRHGPAHVTVWPGIDWLRILCRLGHAVVTSPEVVVRTSLQKKIGGYLPHLPHTGDHEMWMRFAINSDVAFIKGVDQAYYRSHGTNMTNERRPIVDLRQRKAAYDAIFQSFAEQIPDADPLYKRACRRIAKEALWEACRCFHRQPANPALAAELCAFARSTYPESERLPEFWGLRWRQVAGPELSASLRPFLLVSGGRRRLRTNFWWWRWKRIGY
jgi:hypothetical protein